jgi:hypothetical protein
MADLIQMIHGYADNVQTADIEQSLVVFDTDVYDNNQGIWVSKQCNQWQVMDFIVRNKNGYMIGCSQTANIVAPQANQPQTINWNWTSAQNGIGLYNGNGFSPNTSGNYLITVSVQVTKSSGGSPATVDLWLTTINGALTQSNRRMTIHSNNEENVLVLNHIVYIGEGTQVSVKYAVTDVALIFKAEAANAIHPFTPSAQITIRRL